MKGLRRQQRIESIRKEFEKSPDNPFNQAGEVGEKGKIMGRYDMKKDEAKEIVGRGRKEIEGRLAG